MKLMFTLRDDFLTFNRVIIGNYQYTHWCAESLRVTTMTSAHLPKVPKGTVMPKDWMR